MGRMLESRFKHSIVASALLSVLEELRLLYSFRFSTFGEWRIEFDLAVTYFSPTPHTICPPLFASSLVYEGHQYSLMLDEEIYTGEVTPSDSSRHWHHRLVVCRMHHSIRIVRQSGVTLSVDNICRDLYSWLTCF